MSDLHSDIVEEHGIDESEDGYTAVRRFIISGVTGSASQIALNALNDSRIPKRKESHPTIPSIKVDTRSARIRREDPRIVEITINYRVLPDEETTLPVFQLGTTSVTEETNYAFGKNNPESSPNVVMNAGNAQEQMVIKYLTGAPDYTTKTTTPKISREFPSGTITFSRREDFNPIVKKRKFEGSVNSNNFMGDEPFTWLCSRIVGTTTDGGLTFNVDYEFQYKKETWNVSLFYEDPDTKQIPRDARAHVFAPYPANNFDELDIPLPGQSPV